MEYYAKHIRTEKNCKYGINNDTKIKYKILIVDYEIMN